MVDFPYSLVPVEYDPFSEDYAKAHQLMAGSAGNQLLEQKQASKPVAKAAAPTSLADLMGEAAKVPYVPPALPEAKMENLPELQKSEEGKGFWNWLMGVPESTSYAAVKPNWKALPAAPGQQNALWPTENDLAIARKYDQFYGSAIAPTVAEGAMVNKANAKEVVNTHNKGTPLPEHLSPADELDRRRLETAAIAANKSAVATLGFDPRKVTSTPPLEPGLTAEGFYRPVSDEVWYAEKDPSSVIHESFHRGIHELEKAIDLPKYYTDRNYRKIFDQGFNAPTIDMNEMFVRALMQKHFGWIETKDPNLAVTPGEKGGSGQIDMASRLMDDSSGLAKNYKAVEGETFSSRVDKLEKMAEEHLAKAHPRGPR